MLSRIIFVCVAVWLFSLLFGVIEYLFALNPGTSAKIWDEWFALNSDTHGLLRKPWTLVTYAFLHTRFWDLLWNMILLYCSGLLCGRYLGARRFGWIYFLSAIVGGGFFVLCWNIFPVFYGQCGMMKGAYAAVLGTFVAIATYMPEQEIGLWLVKTFNVKLRWIAWAIVGMDLLSVGSVNICEAMAHGAGAGFGWFFVWIGRKKIGYEIGGFRIKCQDFFKKHLAKKKVQDKWKRSGRPISDQDFNNMRAQDEKRVDEILDKISKSGYEALSKEEKEFLFNYKAR